MAEPIEIPFGIAIRVGSRNHVFSHVRSFVRCLRARVQRTLDPMLRLYSGPVRLPRERKGIDRCVRCVLATCGEGRLSRSGH